MIEKQNINEKDVWLKVDPLHVERDNPNVIPTEYFTVAYFFEAPSAQSIDEKILKDEEGEPKLFESPVAAISYASKKLQEIL